MLEKIIYIGLFLLPGILFSAAPGGYAGSFLEIPPMSSSAAFGNACITYDPEPAALFANPANLDGLYRHSAQFSIERLPMSDFRYGAAGTFRWRQFQFALGAVQHCAGNIQGRDEVGNPTKMLDYSNTVVGGGASFGMEGKGKIKRCGTALWKISFGMSGYFVAQGENFSDDGSGYTTNIGISARYGYFRGGVLLRNLYGRMKWNDGSTSEFQRAIAAGIGLEFCESHWIEASAEAKVIGRVRWRIGGQFLAAPWAAFRAGIDFSTGTPSAIDETRIAGGGAFYIKYAIPIEISYSAQYIYAIRGFGISSSISLNTF